MTALELPSLYRGVACDKPSCPVVLEFPNPIPAAEAQQVETALSEAHWSMYLGARARRHYCPDHGPAKGTELRKLL